MPFLPLHIAKTDAFNVFQIHKLGSPFAHCNLYWFFMIFLLELDAIATIRN
jgi:hypothetical protein